MPRKTDSTHYNVFHCCQISSTYKEKSWYWLYIICVEHALIVSNKFKDSFNRKCLDRVESGIMNAILTRLRVVPKAFWCDVTLVVVWHPFWHSRDRIAVLMIKFTHRLFSVTNNTKTQNIFQIIKCWQIIMAFFGSSRSIKKHLRPIWRFISP